MSERKFSKGASVVLTSEWHGVLAGTRLVVETPLRPAERGGLYGGDPFQVRREDGGGLPGPWGASEASAVIDGKYLSAA